MDVWITGFFLKSFISFGHQLKEVLYGVYVLKVVYLEPPQLSPLFLKVNPPGNKAENYQSKQGAPFGFSGCTMAKF